MSGATGVILTAVLVLAVSLAVEIWDRRRGVDLKSLVKIRGVLTFVAVTLGLALAALGLPGFVIVAAVGCVWVLVRLLSGRLLGVRHGA